MITHEKFADLRLRDFAAEVVDLDNWQFMGRTWVGEAIGFSEWLRPVESPQRLGSLALDLSDLPSKVSGSVLDRLQLPLSHGMSLGAIRAVLGQPIETQTYVPDRHSYDFAVKGRDAYRVSCTVHDDDGLIYVVVTPAK